MSALPVIFTLDNPDPESCPTNLTETFQIIRESLSGEIQANIVPYVRQATTPGVDQQNLVWHKIDVDGRPIGTYHFYGGAWRREYSGLIGEVVMYSGDPGVDFSGAGNAGTVGGEWDGWQLCTGENGSPDLSDKFIVGAKMSDLGVGYSGNAWKSTVSGSAQQTETGVHEITLTDANTYRPAEAALKVGRWQADGNSANVGGGLYGLGSDTTIEPADAGNTTPDAIPTLPNYYSLAYCQFKGYA